MPEQLAALLNVSDEPCHPPVESARHPNGFDLPHQESEV